MELSAIGSSVTASYANDRIVDPGQQLSDGGTSGAVMKGAMEIQKTLMTQLLQSLGIGQSVDIKV